MARAGVRDADPAVTDRASGGLDPTATPASPPLAPNAPLRAAVTALAGLLKLRKQPFVCPEPKWLVRVVCSHSRKAETGK
jgi:hypothetical protein